MKKSNIINLIKYHVEGNDSGFRTEAYEIARSFSNKGDYQLAEYIMSTLSNANTFLPQGETFENKYLEKIDVQSTQPLPLPDAISSDIRGIINAINHNVGMHKFLFQGAPGTGKTESAKQVARLLNRELFAIDFTGIIDSKLGQTSKNIKEVFDEINTMPLTYQIIILLDEIDSIALDRIDSRDLREMGRVTSTFFKCLDQVRESIVIIATTNLYEFFDKAFLRRFDSVIDFNRYTNEDLEAIGEIILENYLKGFKHVGRNIRLFRKILHVNKKLPYPADLKNIIRTALGFSDTGDEYDYLKRLNKMLNSDIYLSLPSLKKEGFTVREIETLTGISKSQVSRAVNKEVVNE